MAYAVSQQLMEQIDTRRTDNEQCGRGFGSPQAPFGEIYSTHATIAAQLQDVSGTTTLTWRYVVGVQLSDSFNVTARDLAILDAPSSDSTTRYVSYRFDD